MASEQSGPQITRDRWVTLFEDGFKAGVRERKRSPAKRRGDVSDVRDGDHSAAEWDALQTGFEEGRDGGGGVPGQATDIEAKANTAYDRSEYSTDLDQWGEPDAE